MRITLSICWSKELHVTYLDVEGGLSGKLPLVCSWDLIVVIVATMDDSQGTSNDIAAISHMLHNTI